MMTLIFNQDGSIKTLVVGESIQQGNNLVNQIFVSVDGMNVNDYSCLAYFELPNGDVNSLNGTPKLNQDVGGESLNGYLITLTSAQTVYPGTLKTAFKVTNPSNVTLYTYEYEFQVNPTDYEPDESTITNAQYEQLVESLTSYALKSYVESIRLVAGAGVTIDGNVISATTAISLVYVESYSQLPSPGASNTIYLVPGETTETHNNYTEYIWTGTTYERIGSVSTEVDLSGYQKTYTYDSSVWDTTPTNNSTKPITSSGVYTALLDKVNWYSIYNDNQTINNLKSNTNTQTKAFVVEFGYSGSTNYQNYLCWFKHTQTGYNTYAYYFWFTDLKDCKTYRINVSDYGSQTLYDTFVSKSNCTGNNFDETPTNNSKKFITSGGVYSDTRDYAQNRHGIEVGTTGTLQTANGNLPVTDGTKIFVYIQGFGTQPQQPELVECTYRKVGSSTHSITMQFDRPILNKYTGLEYSASQSDDITSESLYQILWTTIPGYASYTLLGTATLYPKLYYLHNIVAKTTSPSDKLTFQIINRSNTPITTGALLNASGNKFLRFAEVQVYNTMPSYAFITSVSTTGINYHRVADGVTAAFAFDTIEDEVTEL